MIKIDKRGVILVFAMGFILIICIFPSFIKYMKQKSGAYPKMTLTVVEIDEKGTENRGSRSSPTGYYELARLQDESGTDYWFKFHKSYEYELPAVGAQVPMYINNGKPELVRTNADLIILIVGILFLGAGFYCKDHLE